MAMMAFLCPRRFGERGNDCGPQGNCLASNGAESALKRAAADIGPARLILVVFFFPALSLFCGVRPAHEQRCFEVGNTDISTPISEMIPIAAKRLDTRRRHNKG